MDTRKTEVYVRYDFEPPGTERPISKYAPQGGTCSIMAPVKAALAYCRKYTRLNSSKTRSRGRKDIVMGSANAMASTRPYQPAHRRRPTPLRTQYGAPDADCYDDSDPFITSPSWLKDEYFGEGART
ncbi:hypothetical protein CC86DRAFT_95608 [Ophiobolus disseminans]|uniref:Uncharacterized protein n=1 Tax=Ophiobolus disseminans TaxID=1469910 RepID=A0A6A6ZMU6_9PLEO|nr:hypothetical protein CC86DRAFT_95608 [Ophiobolus disseminans]